MSEQAIVPVEETQLAKKGWFKKKPVPTKLRQFIEFEPSAVRHESGQAPEAQYMVEHQEDLGYWRVENYSNDIAVEAGLALMFLSALALPFCTGPGWFLLAFVGMFSSIPVSYVVKKIVERRILVGRQTESAQIISGEDTLALLTDGVGGSWQGRVRVPVESLFRAVVLGDSDTQNLAYEFIDQLPPDVRLSHLVDYYDNLTSEQIARIQGIEFSPEHATKRDYSIRKLRKDRAYAARF